LKIISRYILREHIGPFVFAFSALTSLMLLNFISRQFGELVGKGLPWQVIGEFFLLAIPFTVALTIPMSVLVAVLYAFSRLAAENEVTAMKASGVSPAHLVSPTLAGGVAMSLLLLAFNDQVLPRANHELKNLQDDISQAKPTLLLKEQVINPIAEGKLYLKAGKIDQAGGRMREIVIYDLTNPLKRRTIYADTGNIAFAANRVDLDLHLFNGQMIEVDTDKPEQLDRMFYRSDRIRVRDVGRDFKKTSSDSNSKGDREMGICEMQRRFWQAEQQFTNTVREVEHLRKTHAVASFPQLVKVPEPRGLGWAYCRLMKLLPTAKELHAADVTDAGLHRSAQDSAKKTPAQDSAKKAPQDSAKPVQATLPPAAQVPQPPAQVFIQNPAPGANQDSIQAARTQERIAAEAAAALMRGNAPAVTPSPAQSVGVPASLGLSGGSRSQELKIRLELAQRGRDRYDIEIHKKFSLAAACLIFCILAPPIALRFPRGGVGLVIGVSLAVFALYYVGLIGGEAMANKGYLRPFWAMWGTNVLMTVVGLVMLARIGRDSESARGGGIREWLDTRRMLRDERRARGAK
jgi:lipopolysaccharide export system permease protein